MDSLTELVIPEDNFESFEDSFLNSRLFSSSSQRRVFPRCEDQASRYSTPLLDNGHDPANQKWDFMHLMTAISDIYSSGEYLPMRPLNDNHWKPVAGGKDFEVSRTSLKLTSVSLRDQQRTHHTKTRIIVKKMRNAYRGKHMLPQDISVFVHELRILSHLRNHDNIVKLRGVGWILDHDLDDPALAPCPKPAIFLEEAVGTLQFLIEDASALSFQTEMRICKDVATGLQALHECGIIHGDVKPANVLIFPISVFEGGAGVEQYQCKISDFSLSRLAGTEQCWFNWGTKAYIAPEREQKLTSEELMLTDVWSLGILFGVVTNRDLNLTAVGDNPESLGALIQKTAKASIQSSTWDPVMVELRQIIFENTLQTDPQQRRLDLVVESLQSYFKQATQQVGTATQCNDFSRLSYPNKSHLHISYESLKAVSGQVKDAVVTALKRISRDQNDPRRANAFFELATITISGFACPFEPYSTGIAFLKESAALGDIRGRGLLYRVRRAIGNTNPNDKEELSWLEEAATLGHIIAMSDLQALDPERARKSRMKHVAELFGSSNERVSRKGKEREVIPPFISPATISGGAANNLDVQLAVALIHKMAAKGELTELRTFLSLFREEANSKDSDGNTPLILASRYGHYEVVLELLSQGGDPSAQNDAGEGFLHYGWEFSDSELSDIAARLRHLPGAYPSILMQEARGRRMIPNLEMFSTPPGTPLERAISMGKTEAVRVLLGEMRPYICPNGIVLRRALLLALRLHVTDIQLLLLHFMTEDKSSMSNPGLPPLDRTKWEYKGTKRSYMDAVAIGYVSSMCGISPCVSSSSDVPLKWWRICYLGENHYRAVQQSIECVKAISMISETGTARSAERLMDLALVVAMRERFHDSLQALLEAKAMCTSGKGNRLRSLKSLAWHSIPIPLSFTPWLHERITDKMPFLQTMLPSRWTKELPQFKFNKSTVYAITNELDSNKSRTRTQAEIGQDYNPIVQSTSPTQTLLEMDPIKINFVDQVYYKKDKGTLLHQAIESGDRAVFAVLLHVLGANPSLPAQGRDLGEHSIEQLNVYALLAHTAHADLWFARQFHEIGLQFSLPLGTTPWMRDFYFPPLSHALHRGRWAYSLWLLRHGASLEEPVRLSGMNVLSWALSFQEISVQTLEFLFPTDGRGGAFDFLPGYLQGNDGFPVFSFIHDSSQHTTPVGIYADLDQEYEGESSSDESDESDEDDSASFPTLIYGGPSRWERITRWTPWPLRYKAKRVKNLVACWEYLFNAYAQVANSSIRWRAPSLHADTPIPRALRKLVGEWRCIPYHTKCVLEQSLSLGIGSSLLFDVAMKHFEERAELRPSFNPFPLQPWTQLLFGSPLDRLTVRSWKHTSLFQKHKYWPSLHNRVIFGPFIFPLMCYIVIRFLWSTLTTGFLILIKYDYSHDPVLFIIGAILFSFIFLFVLFSFLIFLIIAWALIWAWFRRISPADWRDFYNSIALNWLPDTIYCCLFDD